MLGIFSGDDVELVMLLARELTGTKVNKVNHSVIVQNVSLRLQTTGCETLEEYLAYADGNDEEMALLLSAVTIHTTSWFREVGAFEKLEQLLQSRSQPMASSAPFRVLSIACSTGEEVYSLAATLDRFRSLNPAFDFFIEGWDIDPISLRTAREGNYEFGALETIPARYRPFLVEESVTRQKKFSIKSTIKDRCRFRTVNIMKPPVEVGEYDFIFCRNMLIYFEAPDVASIMSYIRSRTTSGGHFCVGVSETSAVKDSSFVSVGSATYCLKAANIKSQSIDKSSSTSSVVPLNKEKGHTVLIVEDEAELREIMVETVSDGSYRVLQAANTDEALAILGKQSVDLVLSDFRMPGKNGLELCRHARKMGFRGSFVIVSGSADRAMVEDGLALGCNEVVLKPLVGDDLLRLVRVYLGKLKTEVLETPGLIVIGASTGGTEVLVRMLRDMPQNCPPLLVVQHITSGFASDFATRLASATGLRLSQMKNDEKLEAGTLYIALADYHIGVKQFGSEVRLKISHDAPMNSHRPSVDFLFGTAALTRRRVFAALLTGMGKDGANGLLQLKDKGAYTFAQNEESCVVFGMPKEAIKLNAAGFVGDPQAIREKLDRLLDVNQKQSVNATDLHLKPRKIG